MRVRFGKYVPFSYKIMVPYLLLVMLTDAVVGYFSYRTAVRSRTEIVEANVGWALAQMRDNAFYRLNDLRAISDSLFSSPAFQSNLQVAGDRALVHDTIVHSLLPLVETPLRMTAQNIRMIVYVANPGIDEIHGNLDAPINEKSYAILSMSRLKRESWYAGLAAGGEDNVWRQVGNDEAQGNLSLVRKLISFMDYQTEIGFLRISVPARALFQSLPGSELGAGSLVQVSDSRTGQVLYSNDPDRRLSPGEERRYLTLKEAIPGTDIAIEANIPLDVLRQDASRIGAITLLVCGASFVAMAALSVLVARYSGRKMMRIISVVRSFQSGLFAKRIPHRGNDEFAQISSAFNQMAQHIEDLIREVYLRGIQKKEAELQALQSQINPHFLYNTLSSINSLARIGETDKLGAMVAGLARFYRLTLDDGSRLIPIGKEIEQVKSYLDIQAIKYANRFTVGYELEPDILRCETVKLIVQPFVENVFKHAWFGERIHIRIVGRRDGERIELKIIDDGIGMPAHVSERLLKRGREGGCGIRNVHERIRLQYGPDYGVSLHSRLGIGTTVRIVLPYPADPSGERSSEQR